MPSDNLDKFIKEKIEAVQHTLPPTLNWNPEAGWLKLQQQRVPARRQKTNWLPYAAAVFALALLAGLMLQNGPSSQKAVKPVAATAAAEKVLPKTVPANQNPKTVAKHQASISSPLVTPEQPIPKVAGQKPKQLVKVPALPVANSQIKQTPDTTTTRVTDAPATITSGQEFVIPATPTHPAAQPLKIIIVLGKASSAKVLNHTAQNTLPAKKRNSRFRLNVPNGETRDMAHLALTDSAYQLLKLQARIDL